MGSCKRHLIKRPPSTQSTLFFLKPINPRNFKMSEVSPRTINENNYGTAFELTLSKPKTSPTAVTEKLTKTAPREPLTDRIEAAQKRRNSHLSEKVEKAQVKTDVVKSKLTQMEQEMKEKALNANQERIKSAETKRKSLIDEKVAKAKTLVEKAKVVSKTVNEEKQKALQELPVAIEEKLEKCKVKEVKPDNGPTLVEIEQKLSKAELNREKQIQEKLEKCKVKAVKSKDQLEEEERKEIQTKLVKKMSNAEINRNEKMEQELARLREKHEKVEMVKMSKNKSESAN